MKVQIREIESTRLIHEFDGVLHVDEGVGQTILIETKDKNTLYLPKPNEYIEIHKDNLTP